MQTVTHLAPNGRTPGLITWYCEHCSAADSELIYPPVSRTST